METTESCYCIASSNMNTENIIRPCYSVDSNQSQTISEEMSSEDILNNSYECLKNCEIYQEGAKMTCRLQHDMCPFQNHYVFINKSVKVCVGDLISGFVDYINMDKQTFMVHNSGPISYQNVFWSKIYDLFTKNAPLILAFNIGSQGRAIFSIPPK